MPPGTHTYEIEIGDITQSGDLAFTGGSNFSVSTNEAMQEVCQSCRDAIDDIFRAVARANSIAGEVVTVEISLKV